MDVHNIEDLGQRIYHVVCVLHGKCVVVVVDDVDGSLEGVTHQFRLTNCWISHDLERGIDGFTSCSQQGIEIHTPNVPIVQKKCFQANEGPPAGAPHRRDRGSPLLRLWSCSGNE
jgi:hypothetical protein